MKVKDLIMELQKADPEGTVMCPVIAEGYACVDSASECAQDVKFKYNGEWGNVFIISSGTFKIIPFTPLIGYPELEEDA